jgi:hypothetical protein
MERPMEEFEGWLKQRVETGRTFGLQSSQYFVDGPLRTYMRFTRRHYEGKPREVLVMANVSVDEEFRGRGLFKAFILNCERLANLHKKGFMVENVNNLMLQFSLVNHGYVKQGDDYWKVEQEEPCETMLNCCYNMQTKLHKIQSDLESFGEEIDKEITKLQAAVQRLPREVDYFNHQIEMVKTDLTRLIAGRPITKELLLELVPLLELNNRGISVFATKNFSRLDGVMRYFFTVYDKDVAYRICDSYDGGDAPVENGKIQEILGNLGDGYTLFVNGFPIDRVMIYTYTK